jgi:hypothetical protein
MFVPFILNALPRILTKLFAIFKRLLLWNKTEIISTDLDTENGDENNQHRTCSLVQYNHIHTSITERDKRVKLSDITHLCFFLSIYFDVEKSSMNVISTISQVPTTAITTLQRLTVIFLHHLYGLFPCNLIKFLKRECACNIEFARCVEVSKASLILD